MGVGDHDIWMSTCLLGSAVGEDADAASSEHVCLGRARPGPSGTVSATQGPQGRDCHFPIGVRADVRGRPLDENPLTARHRAAWAARRLARGLLALSFKRGFCRARPRRGGVAFDGAFWRGGVSCGVPRVSARRLGRAFKSGGRTSHCRQTSRAARLAPDANPLFRRPWAFERRPCAARSAFTVAAIFAEPGGVCRRRCGSVSFGAEAGSLASRQAPALLRWAPDACPLARSGACRRWSLGPAAWPRSRYAHQRCGGERTSSAVFGSALDWCTPHFVRGVMEYFETTVGKPCKRHLKCATQWWLELQETLKRCPTIWKFNGRCWSVYEA